MMRLVPLAMIAMLAGCKAKQEEKQRPPTHRPNATVIANISSGDQPLGIAFMLQPGLIGIRLGEGGHFEGDALAPVRKAVASHFAKHPDCLWTSIMLTGDVTSVPGPSEDAPTHGGSSVLRVNKVFEWHFIAPEESSRRTGYPMDRLGPKRDLC